MKAYSIAVCVYIGIAVYFLEACNRPLTSEATNVSEQARLTSPNGQLDAVLIREDGGGAAGGWEWYVYIVAKGNRVDQRHAHAIFNAGTLTDAKLVWSQEHLLQIGYNIAYINQFSNIWGSDELHEARNGSEYLVEIRLLPSQPDFSLLTPDGRFRQKK
jgi:hypothetical protein